MTFRNKKDFKMIGTDRGEVMFCSERLMECSNYFRSSFTRWNV